MESEPKNTSHPRATEHKHNQQEHNHEQPRVNQGYTILENEVVGHMEYVLAFVPAFADTGTAKNEIRTSSAVIMYPLHGTEMVPKKLFSHQLCNMEHGSRFFFRQHPDMFNQFPLKIRGIHNPGILIQKFRQGDTEAGKQLFQNIN